MKKILSIIMLCFCITVATYAQKPNAPVQKKQVFGILPSVLKQGDKIQITYNPIVNGVDAKVPVKGSIYLFKDFKWTGYDLPLVKSDSGYTTSYQIPLGVAMLACRFSIGDSIDRGGRFPYASVVYEKDKQMAPGGYIEWGLLRSKDANGNLSPLVAKEALIQPSVLVQLWVAREFDNPLVKRNLFFDIARGIKAYLPKAKADSILLKTATKLTSLNDVTEKELIAVEKTYRNVLENQSMADSLKTVILSKYPNGLRKRLELINAIYLARDQDQKLQLWDNFVKTYPFTSFPYADYVDPVLGDKAFFINSFLGVANFTYQKHDLVKVTKLVYDGPFEMINYFYDHYVIFPFRQQVSPITDQEALSLSVSFTDILMKRINAANPIDRGIFAPTEWKKQEMFNNAGVWANHVALLYKNGQYKTALEFADKVKPYIGTNNINFNDVYVKLLVKLKREKEAYPFIRKAIADSFYTSGMVEVLEKNYIAKHKNTKGFDEYIFSLKSKEGIAREHAAVLKAMCNIPIEPFKLKNLKGEEVDLSKHKGKVVVLDFWATWCYPCKQAMPGMQLAVNKYDKDQNVEFYFISTLEVDPNYKKFIDQFLKEKKYTFNVLYDEVGNSGEIDKVYSVFSKAVKASGIPLKVIIDPKGNIRWTNLGGSSNAIQIADEVSYVIDLLKKEKE